MYLVKMTVALLLAIVLAFSPVCNAQSETVVALQDVAPASLPTINESVAVRDFLRWLPKHYPHALRKIGRLDADIKTLGFLVLVAVLSYGGHPQVLWAASLPMAGGFGEQGYSPDAARKSQMLQGVVERALKYLPENVDQSTLQVREDLPIIEFHDRRDSMPREMMQTVTVCATWAEEKNEDTGLRTGIHMHACDPGQMPEDKELKRAFWGEWGVRIPYENARMPYVVFLCRDAAEILSVLVEVGRGINMRGSAYFPAFALMGDKGCHIVFTQQQMGPKNWLTACGYQFPDAAFTRSDVYWKAMKRFRRTVATCDLYIRERVLETKQDFDGVRGATWQKCQSPVTGETYTKLYTPVAWGKNGTDVDGYGDKHDYDWTNDGSSECRSNAFTKLVGKAMMEKRGWHLGPLSGVSIRGCTPAALGGTLKGHLRVNTPAKDLAADFVISDAKAEMVTTGHSEFGILFTCHKYAGARTDAISVMHYGFEKFLPIWVREYMGSVKTALTDAKLAQRWLSEEISDTDDDEVSKYALVELQKQVSSLDTPWDWHKVPYFFRLLTNALMASFRKYTSQDNDGHKVAIPLPRGLFTRRYVMLWEDATDRYGRPTNTGNHMLAEREVLLAGWTGKCPSWRQPNGTPKDWVWNDMVSILGFSARYSQFEKFEGWVNNSPFAFIAAANNKPRLAVNGGEDFDDSEIFGRSSSIVAHFEWLSTLVYPETDHPKPVMEGAVDGHTVLDWGMQMNLLKTVLDNGGIGMFVNPLVAYNMYVRLIQTDAKWRPLLNGVTAPMYILGRQLEVVIDSYAKFGGIGLNGYKKIYSDFVDQVQWASESIIWRNQYPGMCQWSGRLGAKTSSKLRDRNRLVKLPLDEAFAAVRTDVAEFSNWVEYRYRTLPTTWGTDRVLWNLDYYPATEEVKHFVSAVMERYAANTANLKGFGSKKAVSEYMENLQNLWKQCLDNQREKENKMVMAELFRQVYNSSPRRRNEQDCYRFACEDLLWGSGALYTMFRVVLPDMECADHLQTPGQIEFPVMDDLKLKLESGKVTASHLIHWRNLGAQNRQAVVRLVDGIPVVFVQHSKTGEDVRIGYTNNRHIGRVCALLGDVPMTIMAGTEFTLRGVWQGKPLPVPPPSKSASVKLTVEERDGLWLETDRRITAAVPPASSRPADTSCFVKKPAARANVVAIA